VLGGPYHLSAAIGNLLATFEVTNMKATLKSIPWTQQSVLS
jgi:hypothetical protein